MGRDHSRTSDILEAVTLLVVDMQETFLNTIPDSDSVVRRCAFAIEAARTLGIRVIFTEQVPEKLGHTAPALRELAPEARVFPKNSFSALGANGLPEHLRKTGVYHLLIAGIETPVCVYQTALHAQDSDFDVTILSDCVTGRRNDDGRVILQALAAASCHVLPAETVFYSMLGNSAHHLFSAFTELVKAYGENAPPVSPKARARKPRPKTAEPVPAASLPEPDEAPAEMARPSRELPEDGEFESISEFDDVPEEAEAESAEATMGDGARGDQPTEGRKRPRRRRGGARRRKARERATVESGNAGAETASGENSGPPPVSPESTASHDESPSEAREPEA